MHIQKEFPYKLMNKYPGMRPGDEVIWDEFIKNHPTAFARVWYDVPLGDPFPDEAAKREAQATGAWDVSRWRIDVLAENGEGLHVIEIKPLAGASALGQAIAYRRLLWTEWNVQQPTHSVVLTDSISPIMEKAAALCGVRLMVA